MIGISADSQATADRFKHSLELPFPMLGDPRGEIGKAYGVRWPLVGHFRRTTFVIGKDRRIKLAFRSDLDAEAHVAEACAVTLGG